MEDFTSRNAALLEAEFLDRLSVSYWSAKGAGDDRERQTAQMVAFLGVVDALFLRMVSRDDVGATRAPLDNAQRRQFAQTLATARARRTPWSRDSKILEELIHQDMHDGTAAAMACSFFAALEEQGLYVYDPRLSLTLHYPSDDRRESLQPVLLLSQSAIEDSKGAFGGDQVFRMPDLPPIFAWMRRPAPFVFSVASVTIILLIVAMFAFVKATTQKPEPDAVTLASAATAVPLSEHDGLDDEFVADLANDQNRRDLLLAEAPHRSSERDQALAALDPISASDFHDDLVDLLHRQYPTAVWYAGRTHAMHSALRRCWHLAFREAACHAAYLAGLVRHDLPAGFDPYERPTQQLDDAFSGVRRDVVGTATALLRRIP